MPDTVEQAALGLWHGLQAEARQDVVEDHAMQFVDPRPAQFARHHARHRRPVALAPGQREGVAIDLRVQPRHFGHDAAVPVDHGAEDVEGEDFGGEGGHGLAFHTRHWPTAGRRVKGL